MGTCTGCKILIKSNSPVTEMTADSTSVYYTTTEDTTPESGRGAVYRVTIADGIRTMLAPAIRPGAILVDAAHVYWAETGSIMGNRFVGGAVRRIPLAGGAVETLTAAGEQPSALAADATHLYVGMMKDGKGLLVRFPKAGGPSQMLYELPFASAQAPGRIAVGGTNVYFISSSSAVFSVPVAGGAAEMTNVGTIPSTIDTDASNVYIAAALATNKSIRKKPFAGGAWAPIFMRDDLSSIRDLGVDSTAVYWVEWWNPNGVTTRQGKVWRAGLDGSNPVAVASGFSTFGPLAMNTTALFFIHVLDENSNVDKSQVIMQAPK
jgi:hypothetical protein